MAKMRISPELKKLIEKYRCVPRQERLRLNKQEKI